MQIQCIISMCIWIGKTMIGHKFCRLTVVSELPRIYYKSTSSRLFLCKCDCGNVIKSTPSNLNSGRTKSCGCLKIEKSGLSNKTHGMSQTDEYKIWCGIIKRCKNERYREFHLYGGRGISVSKNWMSFENFYKDMGVRPSKNHSIDRIDPNGNYEKENCVWADKIQQGLNQRRTNSISFKNVKMSLRQFSKLIGISYYTIYSWVVRKDLNEIELSNKINSLLGTSSQPMFPESLMLHKPIL